jgi:hypothetical protein
MGQNGMLWRREPKRLGTPSPAAGGMFRGLGGKGCVWLRRRTKNISGAEEEEDEEIFWNLKHARQFLTRRAEEDFIQNPAAMRI